MAKNQKVVTFEALHPTKLHFNLPYKSVDLQGNTFINPLSAKEGEPTRWPGQLKWEIRITPQNKPLIDFLERCTLCRNSPTYQEEEIDTDKYPAHKFFYIKRDYHATAVKQIDEIQHTVQALKKLESVAFIEDKNGLLEVEDQEKFDALYYMVSGDSKQSDPYIKYAKILSFLQDRPQVMMTALLDQDNKNLILYKEALQLGVIKTSGFNRTLEDGTSLGGEKTVLKKLSEDKDFNNKIKARVNSIKSTT